MRLDHPDYIKLVTAAYNKKRANNELSPLLAQSTPANIRRECANVYQERFEKRDEPALRVFFGPAEHGRKFLEVIQDFDATKFKPLDSYLKGTGKKRINDRNLELLAWLIDFQHRPYVFDKNVLLSDEELSIIGKSINNTGKKPAGIGSEDDDLKKEGKGREESENLPTKEPDEKETVTQVSLTAASINNTDENKPKRAVIFFLILIICIGSTYAIWQEKRDNQIAMGNVNTGCMYWAGDSYAEMPCNEERSGRLKLPMNPEKMKNFKRITREDTITEKSIGKIYYIRIDGRIEYYTTGGNHPVDVTRTLKVLSSYMFFKHLRKQETANKDFVSDENLKFINNR